MEERILVGRDISHIPYIYLNYERIRMNKLEPGSYEIKFNRRTIHIRKVEDGRICHFDVNDSGNFASNARSMMDSVRRFFYDGRVLPINEWNKPIECYPTYVAYGKYKKSTNEWIFSKWEKQ